MPQTAVDGGKPRRDAKVLLLSSASGLPRQDSTGASPRRGPERATSKTHVGGFRALAIRLECSLLPTFRRANRLVLERRHQLLQVQCDLGQFVGRTLRVAGSLGRTASGLSHTGGILSDFVAALRRLGDVAADLARGRSLLL